MKVIRASSAGFCLGVSLALKKLESLIEKNKTTNGPRICTLGPIIHNPQVLAHFENQGVACVSSVEEARPLDCILIRAHGIPQLEETILRNRCTSVKDATCPKVKKAQLSIAKATKGKTLLLFGEATHPEVRGLVSYAQGYAHVFSSPKELESLKLSTKLPYVLASQTTQDKTLFGELSAKLKAWLPDLQILSTICDATQERQKETQQLAKDVDIMIVTGGKSSGNTRRLADIAAQACKRAYHIEDVAELQPDWFEDCQTIGLTAGASTPKAVIDAIEKRLLEL